MSLMAAINVHSVPQPQPPTTTAHSSLFNLTSWTNLTQYAPSAMDFLLAGPRIAKKIGSFAWVSFPEAVDNAINLSRGQRMIPKPTGIASGIGREMATTAGPPVHRVVQASADILKAVEGQGEMPRTRLSVDGIRGLGNFFHYATSKWAWSCIFMAIILNRTQVYASMRRNLTLGWKVRLAMRFLPIVLFLAQIVGLLRSIQCQTSPHFAELRWGNASKSSEWLFHENSGAFLHTISATVLLGSSDAASCRAVGMIPAEGPGDDPPELRGSLSRLFPLFETFCFSQFVEALSAAVQGRPPPAEFGMELFEHTLAFAEADATISTRMWGHPAATKILSRKNMASDELSAVQSAVKLKSKINAAPEVLWVGALSAGNHLTSHILGVFDRQKRFRLYNTGFWGLCFMLAIVWSFISFSADEPGNHSLLRFPTVCIVGLMPYIMVVIGILMCTVIYGTALLLSALSPSSPQEAEKPFLERLLSAHENLQTNISVPHFARPSYELDAHSALLKFGFTALTVASEAVYLNESREVKVKRMTWLEEERWAEIEANGARWLGPNFRSLDDPADGASTGLVANHEPPMRPSMNSSSGYVRERVPQKFGRGKLTEPGVRHGVGATERSGRWIIAMDLFVGIFRLMAGWFASLILASLSSLGWPIRPAWLVRWIRKPTSGDPAADDAGARPDSHELEFWMVDEQGERVLPSVEHVDVENELRKREIHRLQGTRRRWGAEDEKKLGITLYEWWKNNGWWGEVDTSGSFEPTPSEADDDDDDDTTSVLSLSTNATARDAWESDDGSDSDDGRRTPTPSHPSFSRAPTPAATAPDTPLDPDDLARLLHPRTPADRAEATALSLRLSSPTVLTRARLAALHRLRRAQVLLTRTRPRPATGPGSPLGPEEEGLLLEHLLLARRRDAVPHESAEAEGADGPLCVVCQGAPRSIIVWPCRCLSLCDECRVQLAMNNFERCVCCRGEVGAFSRVFVP